MKYLIFIILILASLISHAQEKPNIVVVLLDDAGFMDFGVYGSDTNTPTINSIANRGALFSRYYSSPSCGPSRAMLMTGQDHHAIGMGALNETITDEMRKTPAYSMEWGGEQKTVASRLKDAGYQTFISGKWGIGKAGKNLPNRFGFDRSFVLDATGGNNYDMRSYLPSKSHSYWFEDGKPTTLPKDFYSSQSLVDKMISYVDQADSSRPFFAFISMQALHIPVQVPKKWIDKYNGVFDKGWDVLRQERLQKAIELGLVPADAKLSPPPAYHRPWDSLSQEDKKYWSRVMQVSAGMMEAADYHTGRFLDYLEKKGKLENTIVIITSDNGAESASMAGATGAEGALINFWMMMDGYNKDIEHLGEASSLTNIGPEWASVSSAPFQFYKFNGSEGGLRVPFVIAGPGIEKIGLQNGRAHVTDITPTILEYAGISYSPDEFNGRSLMPILSGKRDAVYSKDDVVGFEVQGTGAILKGDWKITRIPPPLGDGLWHLYNIAQDPGETNDLSLKNPVLFQELLNEYEKYAKKVGIFNTGINDSARKQLSINQIKNSAKRYWPVTLLLVLFGIGIFSLPIIFIRRFV